MLTLWFWKNPMQDEEVSRDGEVGYYPLIISFAEDCDGNQPNRENVLQQQDTINQLED